MVIRFESKKDWTFPIIWGFVFIVYAAIAVMICYNGGDFSELYVLAGVWIGLGILFYTLLKTTFYTVDEEHLICHIVGFKKKILLKEIKKNSAAKRNLRGIKNQHLMERNRGLLWHME